MQFSIFAQQKSLTEGNKQIVKMETSESKEQIEEIKGLLSSKNKPLAYSKLLHFQQQSTEDTSSIQILVDSIHDILSPVVVDIANYDEEMYVL